MKLSSLFLLAPLALVLPQDEPAKAPPGPEVGKPAPVFTLNDHTGKKVTIGGEAEAWRVIACYPKAMTGG